MNNHYLKIFNLVLNGLIRLSLNSVWVVDRFCVIKAKIGYQLIIISYYIRPYIFKYLIRNGIP